MSVPVALDELARRLQEFGTSAFLITSGADNRPHVVSVTVDFDGRALRFPAGRTSTANVAAHPDATLLWPGPGGPYCLLVDGRTRADGEALILEPGRAVLHRVADAPADLPSCIRIEPDS